jgi:hypothetical protein
MMFLVVHLEMCGRRPEGASLVDPKQPKPYRLEARLFVPGVEDLQSFGFTIRPDGWKVPKGRSQVAAERGGYQDPPSKTRTPLPVVPLSNLAAFAQSANHILVHDREAFDWAIGTWRAQCGKKPEWIGHAHETTDTAELARAMMGAARRPTLAEATSHFFSEPLDGCAGVIALFNRFSAAVTGEEEIVPHFRAGEGFLKPKAGRKAA